MTDISYGLPPAPNPKDQWAGHFGNQYTERNRVDWQRRASFWAAMMKATQARSVLEIGCNAGWNMTAIRSAVPWIGVRGVDVNKAALEEARAAGLAVAELPASEVGKEWSGLFDLTFTAGLLIHIPPQELQPVMRAIAQASRRYVLAIEYAADVPEEIIYQGHAGMLWKRPYGKLYEELGLKRTGFNTFLTEADGFDNCTAYLLEKPC